MSISVNFCQVCLKWILGTVIQICDIFGRHGCNYLLWYCLVVICSIVAYTRLLIIIGQITIYLPCALWVIDLSNRNTYKMWTLIHHEYSVKIMGSIYGLVCLKLIHTLCSCSIIVIDLYIAVDSKYNSQKVCKHTLIDSEQNCTV